MRLRPERGLEGDEPGERLAELGSPTSQVSGLSHEHCVRFVERKRSLEIASVDRLGEFVDGIPRSGHGEDLLKASSARLERGRRPPNGSRLSCGGLARKRSVRSFGSQQPAGAQTEFYLTCARPSASSAC